MIRRPIRGTFSADQAAATEQATLAWLRFNAWRGVSLRDKHRLLQALESPQSVLVASRANLAELLQKRVPVFPESREFVAELELAKQHGCHIICFNDRQYPEALKQLSDPPLLLYAKGDLACLSLPQVAIVGSRRLTPSGGRAAEQFAAELSALGFVITSGLALGVDAAAHASCLAAQGKTIAVLGHGLDQIYPARNRELAARVVGSGCLLSEWPPGVPPRKEHFPQRNRIIAGLACSVLVVEAAERSGSLITARLAAEQGKEVFAVPGSIYSPQSSGCHWLIQQGAMLVRSIEDIVSCIEPILRHQVQELKQAKSSVEYVEENDCPLLKLVDYAPTSLEEIITRSGLTSSEVSSMLCELELAGLIMRGDDGCYVRI